MLTTGFEEPLQRQVKFWMLRDGSAIRVHGPYVRKHARTQLAAWSSGMILTSGARGPGFNSRSSPFVRENVKWGISLAHTFEQRAPFSNEFEDLARPGISTFCVHIPQHQYERWAQFAC